MFFVSRCSLYISGSLGTVGGLSFDVFFFVCFFLNGAIVIYLFSDCVVRFWLHLLFCL